jgi:hypothetical protein
MSEERLGLSLQRLEAAVQRLEDFNALAEALLPFLNLVATCQNTSTDN